MKRTVIIAGTAIALLAGCGGGGSQTAAAPTPTFTTTEAAFKSPTHACRVWRDFWKTHGIDTVPGADRQRQNAGRLESWQKEFESWAARARGVDASIEQALTRVAVTAPLAAASLRRAADTGALEDTEAMISNLEDLTAAIEWVNTSCGS